MRLGLLGAYLISEPRSVDATFKQAHAESPLFTAASLLTSSRALPSPFPADGGPHSCKRLVRRAGSRSESRTPSPRGSPSRFWNELLAHSSMLDAKASSSSKPPGFEHVNLPSGGSKPPGFEHVNLSSGSSKPPGFEHVNLSSGSKPPGFEHVNLPSSSKPPGFEHVILPSSSKPPGFEHVILLSSSKPPGFEHVNLPNSSKPPGFEHVNLPSNSKPPGFEHVNLPSDSKSSGSKHVPSSSKPPGFEHVQLSTNTRSRSSSPTISGWSDFLATHGSPSTPHDHSEVSSKPSTPASTGTEATPTGEDSAPLKKRPGRKLGVKMPFKRRIPVSQRPAVYEGPKRKQGAQSGARHWSRQPPKVLPDGTVVQRKKTGPKPKKRPTGL